MVNRNTRVSLMFSDALLNRRDFSDFGLDFSLITSAWGRTPFSLSFSSNNFAISTYPKDHKYCEKTFF